MTNNEFKEMKDSIKRHNILMFDIGTDIKQLDEEYTGGSKIWQTTDFFKKIYRFFAHSNFLVKCFDMYLDEFKAEIEQLKHKHELAVAEREANVKGFTEQIETLTVELQAMRGAANSYKMHYENAKVEGAKEFAERLKSKHRRILDYDEAGFSAPTNIVYVETIDNLVKEFTEGKNDE